jgi:hypothetical protein
MIRYVLASLVLGITPALAQPAGAQAEVLFRQGRDLLAAGKIDEACRAFAESQKVEPTATTLTNLAGCYEQLGQLATAWGLFLDLERQTRTGSDATTTHLHGLAVDRAAKLEPRISTLTINVPTASQIDGLEISRGSERIDPGMWNRSLPIDGGTYTITARARNAHEWSEQVTVATEHDTKVVEIPVLPSFPHATQLSDEPKPQGPLSLTSTSPTQLPPARTWTVSAPVLIGVGVSGVALLGGALAFDLSGDSTYSQAKDEVVVESRRSSLYSSANTDRYLAQGLLIGGVAAAGVVAWMALFHRDTETPPRTTSMRLIAGPTGFAVLGGFR